MKRLYQILIALIFLTYGFIYTQHASAEVIVFRKETDNCRPMSVTEDLTISSSGGMGRNCSFTVDVRARGDWVMTGGYFDTPPHAWGGDHFYDIYERTGALDGNNNRIVPYSFTCSLPSYAIDFSLMPSFVSMTGSQDIPGSGTDLPPGKRYTFKMGSTAPVGSTFDIPFSFSANCNMFVIKNVRIMADPVTTATNKCKEQSIRNINPRTAARDFVATVSSTSCSGPTVPPVSTTPTRTPTPSRTPTPTPPPGSTPTPTPYHLACSSTSCMAVPGAGSNACGPEDGFCRQTVTGGTSSGSCPSACGPTTVNQSCSCSGPCCPGTCRNGLRCGQSAQVTCCTSTQPQSPTNMRVTQPDGGTIIHTRFVTVTWNFPSGGVAGCGTAWGHNCNGNSPNFVLLIDNDDDYSSPIVEINNISPAVRTYTTTLADGALTANTTYYAQICSKNYLGSCTEVVFTKQAYPVAVVVGSVGEFDNGGTPAFTNTGASDGSIVADINPVAPPTQPGISGSCSTTVANNPSRATGYNCTVTLDNVNNDPNPTQQYVITAINFNPQLYTNPCFQTGATTCDPNTQVTLNLNTNTNGGGAPNITQPLFFSISSSLTFYKLKDTSIQSHGSVNSPFPIGVVAYDALDDFVTTPNYLVIGQSAGNNFGVGPITSSTTTQLGAAQPSQKNWRANSYVPITAFNYQRYLEYVKTRKEYTTVTQLTQLRNNTLHVWNGDLTITNGGQNGRSHFNGKNVVLVVTGTVNFDTDDFTPSSASTAIIANTINFYNGSTFVQQAQGIFAGNTVNLGSSSQPLKVVGNLASTTNSLALTRIRTNNRQPSLFIVFDPDMYVALLKYLSTATYEWKQLQ